MGPPCAFRERPASCAIGCLAAPCRLSSGAAGACPVVRSESAGRPGRAPQQRGIAVADRVTYLLSRADVEKALAMPEAVEAVEAAFRAYGEGRAQMPPKPYLQFEKGDLRAMPAYLPDLGMAAVKNVNVHTGNVELPTVMGTITLFDPDTGFPLAIMDATYLTAVRTGAASGVAARYLAREDSAVVGFIGAGAQADFQLAGLVTTVPGIEKVLVCDVEPDRSQGFAERSAASYHVEARACALAEAVGSADIVTAITPVRQPVIRREHVRPGTHINAIGADAPGKQELEPAILQAAKIVVDNWEQASHGGEINVALSQGLIRREDIYADIGEVVTGRKPGRQHAEEITVFDSTGLAIQDVACAAHVFRQLTSDAGTRSKLRTVDFLELG